MMRSVVGLALILLLALALAQAPRLTTPEEVARSTVIQRSLPAVVKVEGIPEESFGPGGSEPVGGSGFFYSPTRIVTNYHVVQGLKDLRVILHDGQPYPAQVFAVDRGIDIAILTVQGVRAPATLSFGSSQNLPIGMGVVVIGSPFLQRHVVTYGILSKVGPVELVQDVPQTDIGTEVGEVLFTDARTEEGNSGGPMINLQGQVIGVMSMVVGPPSGLAGLGLAIPGDLVRQSVQDLERFGRVQRGWLGATLVDLTDLDPILLRSVGLISSQGAMIDQIEPSSPARSAGLRGAGRNPNGKLTSLGDVILAVNGKAVKNRAEVIQQIARFRVGDKVRLTLWRQGRRVEVTLTMVARS
ncbi:trypsin-like peptidase domain-containing protein [Calidithermus chliarophilus]|uniref:S1C family serine protease n=1 Tax=Calidithermus chliarophilus TaxID=52023 RepID=UPI0012F69A52